MDVVDRVYDLVQSLPKDERLGLCDQLRRASVSVPANIAEGATRDSTKDFLRLLSIARGSLAEVLTLLEVVRRRQFVESDRVDKIIADCDRLGRILSGLRRSLRRRLS